MVYLTVSMFALKCQSLKLVKLVWCKVTLGKKDQTAGSFAATVCMASKRFSPNSWFFRYFGSFPRAIHDLLRWRFPWWPGFTLFWEWWRRCHQPSRMHRLVGDHQLAGLGRAGCKFSNRICWDDIAFKLWLFLPSYCLKTIQTTAFPCSGVVVLGAFAKRVDLHDNMLQLINLRVSLEGRRQEGFEGIRQGCFCSAAPQRLPPYTSCINLYINYILQVVTLNIWSSSRPSWHIYAYSAIARPASYV